MRSRVVFGFALALAAAAAAAQEPVRGQALVQNEVPAPAEVPPPPPMDETPVTLEESGEGPGEKVLPREGGTKTEPDIPPPIQSGEPLPEKVRPSEELAPNVTIRTEGDVTIEEYRRGGQIVMIVVNPKEGVRYTYLDTDGDGRLEGDPGIEGPVRPVYYTLYEWE